MEEKGELEIISRPSIQVVENENAEILVGQQVPVPSGLDPETGQVEVSQEDIGTSLNITPQIMEDGSILMVVEIERSVIGDDVVIQGEPFFTINKQTAASHIRVQDGETIVIGGLIETIERKAHRSVPLLSKIPILGLLFRSKEEEKQFDELMIFLTPHIVNGEKG